MYGRTHGRADRRRRRTVSDHNSSPGELKQKVAFGNKEHVKERKLETSLYHVYLYTAMLFAMLYIPPITGLSEFDFQSNQNGRMVSMIPNN